MYSIMYLPKSKDKNAKKQMGRWKSILKIYQQINWLDIQNVEIKRGQQSTVAEKK